MLVYAPFLSHSCSSSSLLIFFLCSGAADSQQGQVPSTRENDVDDMEEEEEEVPKEGVELAFQMLLFPLTLPGRIYSLFTAKNFPRIFFSTLLVVGVLYLCLLGLRAPVPTSLPIPTFQGSLLIPTFFKLTNINPNFFYYY